jgi:hypothetical protein
MSRGFGSKARDGAARPVGKDDRARGRQQRICFQQNSQCQGAVRAELGVSLSLVVQVMA